MIKISKNNLGKVYRGITKYIDKETKKDRNYVVIGEDKKGVTVAKLKSIKKFDSKNRNADKSLQEINHKNYGLPKRTGVYYRRYKKNIMSNKNLTLADKDVFPEQKERFKLGSHDLSRALRHTKMKK